MPRTGQPPKLTPAVQQAIVNAVSVGVSLTCAAELAGLDRSTVSLWMSRGAGIHPTLKQTTLYINFFNAVTRARASDQARRITRLEQAGRGGAVIYRETVTHRDGSATVRERFEPPNIQADMFHLERRYHEDWGRKDRLDIRLQIHQAATKVAAELGLTMDEVLAEAQTFLAESATVHDDSR